MGLTLLRRWKITKTASIGRVIFQVKMGKEIFFTTFALAILQTFKSTVVCADPPHIIIIVADDLGFNDVGFHGSTQIPTPNIDALAYSGVILQNYYVQPICTPSRSALLSGKHPIHTGLQCYTIGGPQPYGLSPSEILLPDYLSAFGYSAHHVGKWHLGFFTKEHTPTFRGFESHLGYWSGRIDYYDHTAFENPGYWGYDFRRNMTVADDCYGKYATDLFTDEAVNIIQKHNASKPLFLYLAHLAVHSGNPYAPLQAPKEIVEKFSYIEDENRRKFAGMLWKLDESVGHVIDALDRQQMLQNAVILFTSDNGGPAGGFNLNAASNWPLRGVKASMWEGGVRGAGFIWSPKLLNPGRVSHEMLHITDWLPTLISAAGGDVSSLGAIDGVDQWKSLSLETSSPRKEFLVNIDPMHDSGAVRIGDWKLMFRPQAYGSFWDSWFGPSGRNETAPETQLDVILAQVLNSSVAHAVKKIIPDAYANIKSLRESAEVHCDPVPLNVTKSCESKESPCLFHIPSDPCEYNDIAALHPDVVSIAKILLAQYNATAIPPGNKPFDPAANPKYWGYTWTNWKDYPTPLTASVEEVAYSYDIYGDIRTD
ncbi:arylsulfatase B-like isoform X2 [Macrobrachium nipponense]|uniref:arylsulfatase B-like isoform X2 n=1 Tax=Macrobrachium nipponense TaxID=159736 RepID=UPI0030C89FF7